MLSNNLIETLIESAKAAQWSIMIGAILMILIYVVRQLLGETARQNATVARLMDVGGGVIVAVATALLSQVTWVEAVLFGFVVSSSAAGLWSLCGEMLARKLRGNK